MADGHGLQIDARLAKAPRGHISTESELVARPFPKPDTRSVGSLPFRLAPGYLSWVLRLGCAGVCWLQRTAPQPVASFELNWRKCRAARLTPAQDGWCPHIAGNKVGSRYRGLNAIEAGLAACPKTAPSPVAADRKPEVDIPCINLADTCLHKKDGVEPGRRHGASHGQAPERLALSPVLRRRFRLSASTPSRQLIGPVADGPADRSWMWA
jgi:hypothetical protein